MTNSNNRRRLLSGWWVPAMVFLAWGVGSVWVGAQVASAPATRIEEDWELVVSQPDTNNNGPQVTCSISPLTMDAMYAAFDINYRTQPDYSPGGLQLHTWDPNDPIVTQNLPVSGMLATPGETVTWTTRMYLREGLLKFRIVNGQSQTWGAFASPHSISIPTQLVALDSYDPNVSVGNSGVSFASNLVDSLTLKAVRWYDVSGNLIREVTDPQTAYPKP